MRISDWSSDVCSSDLEEELFWVAGHSIGARRESRLDENAKSTSQSAPQPTPGAIFMVNVNIMRHNGISANLVAGLGSRSAKPAGSPCGRAAFGPAASRWYRATACEAVRSEELKSELQSLMRIPYAVCGLKKKTQT